MGRAAACLGIVLALAIGAPQLAVASSPQPQPPPRAALNGFGCHRSSDSLNRWIAITAVMRPVSGTQRMAMKFQLLRKRAHGQAFNDVSGGDLGKWIRPTNPPTLGQRPGDHWTVQKQVVNLAAPAVYKLRVSFRWFGTGQTVLQTVVKFTQKCHQSA